MLRLHLLGTLRLDGDPAAERRAALSQPRRAALLVYLALRARQGPQRRDTLLAVFWPESDTDHARGALRNALHYLRGALGPGVIKSRGSEEILLDPGRLWCDAVEFERLCDAGDHAAALRLYGGDLLDGFFISEAPEFERWLDGERARLRQLAGDAARTLAARAESEGELGLAIHLHRFLTDLTPTDETAIRELMRLHVAAGDRGEALRVFAETRARLEKEYELEPAEETRALADAIRAGQGGLAQAAEAAPGPIARSGPGPAAPAARPAAAEAAEEPEPGPSAAGRRPGPAAFLRRRRSPGGRVKLIAAAAPVVLAAIAVAVALRPGGADTGSPDTVAVLPFDYRGSAEHAYLAEGLADLLAANLDGAGELRTVDPRALLVRARSLEHPIQPRTARRVAADHDAAAFVLGSITEAAGRVRIAAGLYGPDGRAPAVTADVVVEGGADDLLELVDRLTLGLLQGRGASGMVRSGFRTTYSVEALKSFLRGEAALRSADLHGAIQHYRHAAELDSTFALAHYRLSSTAYRQGVTRIPARAAADALRHSGRLVREDSLLVVAWNNHVGGSVAEAHQLYLEALVVRPSHVEAAFQLGELRFHWGSSIGVPAAEAREPFSRVLAAEPSNAQAALHLARLAARDGRPAEVDSLVAVMRRAEPGGSWEVEMDALRAFLSDDAAWQDRAIDRAGRQPERDRVILEAVAAVSYNLAAVERVARARLGIDRTPVDRARMELFIAHVQLARGRYRDALRGIESATALPPPRRLEYRAMMPTLPFLPLPAEELAAVRAEIAAHPDLPLRDEGGPVAGRGVEYPHLLWPGTYRPRRLYLLGALHVRLGDTDAAHAVADSLARFDPDEPLTFHYERLTRARARALTGPPAAALSALGPPRPPPIRTFETLVDHGRPFERWLRAELLRETGRLAEALQWYATFPDPIARDLAYLAPSHLRRAEIHEILGDRAQAAFHYRRFVELWTDADPELQLEVARARDRLGELSR